MVMHFDKKPAVNRLVHESLFVSLIISLGTSLRVELLNQRVRVILSFLGVFMNILNTDIVLFY